MRAGPCTKLLLVHISVVCSVPANPQSISIGSAIGAPGSGHSNVSSITAIADHCFEQSLYPRLLPANHQDCTIAIEEILQHDHHSLTPRTFSRSRGTIFRLPWFARYRTCVVSLDVINDEDSDFFPPWMVYTAAVSLANACVDTDHNVGGRGLGGKMTVGPRNLVILMVFGRKWTVEEDDEEVGVLVLNGSDSKNVVARSELRFPLEQSHVISREAAASQTSSIALHSESGKQDGPDVRRSRNLSRSSANGSVIDTVSADGEQDLNTIAIKSNMSSVLGLPSLGNEIKCYDPPMQRERLYPISISDCEQATIQIIGDRDKYKYYIFSREAIKSPFYYPMPARYEYGSCVVLLDMENDDDVERVRPVYVESSAWVLAHKCSGKEIKQYKYGGSMTVGVGANDLIRIHVYGTWPRSSDETPTLSLSQNNLTAAA